MIEHPALGLRSENRSATAMGTDDNGYELAVCHQLGKATKLRTGTRFSTDSSRIYP